MANLGSQSRNYWKKFHLPFHHSTIFMTSFLLSVSFFHLFIIFATDLPAHVLTDILREHKKFCFKFDGRFFSLTCLQICSLRFRALKGKFRPEWVGLRSKRARGDGQTDKQTNGQMSPVPCVWQDFVPLGPLPCFLSFQFTIMQCRATESANNRVLLLWPEFYHCSFLARVDASFQKLMYLFLR